MLYYKQNKTQKYVVCMTQTLQTFEASLITNI